MDHGAYDDVLREQRDRVYSYAAYLLGQRDEADDVVQEAFLRLWLNRAKIDEQAAARAWLMRTAHNLCMDRLRSSSRGRRLEDTVREQTTPMAPPSPERMAHSDELREQITRALEDVPEEQRSALIMREVLGMPYKQIAEAANVPLGTLKARLHRAREALRLRLKQQGVTP